MRRGEATNQPRAGKSGEEESSMNRGSWPGRSGGNDSGLTKAVLGRAEAEAEHATYLRSGQREEAVRAAKQGVQGTVDKPMHIPFRVFEDPRKCVETEEIVKRLVLLYDPTGVEAVESISTMSLCPDELSTLETHSENLASCCLCIHMNTGKLRGGNAPTSCVRAAVLTSRSTPSDPLRSALRQADAQHSPLPVKVCSCSR